MRTFIIALTTTVLIIALSQTSMAQFRENAKQADPAQNASQSKTAALIVETPTDPTTPATPPPKTPANSFTDQHSGITFEALPLGNGIRVKNVDKFGLGARNGLEPGDVIKEFNGRAVSSHTDLTNAINAIPNSASGIFLKIVDVNSGITRNVPYSLSTNAGIYATNFGKLELTENPTNQLGVTNWAGTLHFRNKAFGSAKISGSLSNGRFSGTSNHPKFGMKQVALQSDFTGNMYQGTITDSVGPMTFVIIKN